MCINSFNNKLLLHDSISYINIIPNSNVHGVILFVYEQKWFPMYSGWYTGIHSKEGKIEDTGGNIWKIEIAYLK